MDKDIEAYETIYLVPNEPIRDISFYTYDWENDTEGTFIESLGSLKLAKHFASTLIYHVEFPITSFNMNVSTMLKEN